MSLDLMANFSDVSKFNPNNMVIVVRWNGNINLANAFNLLPLQCIEESPSTKKKIKIPYYSVEDVIVSIRYKKGARGLREVPKQPDNFVSIDLQIGGRNVHIKLSSENAVVMGVTSLEKGVEAVECLLDTIYMTDQNLAYLRKVDIDEVTRAYEYIENLSVEKEDSLGLPEADIFCDNLIDYNKTNPKIDEKIATILLARAYEFSTISDFSDAIVKFTQSKPIDEDNVEIVSAEVSNSAYNYKFYFFSVEKKEKVVGYFILKNLASAILSLNNPNITASHHNWHAKYVNVVISTFGIKNNQLNMKNNKKQHIHRFNISETGSIRQWSPSIKEEAYLVHLLLTQIIGQIIIKHKDVFLVPEPDDSEEDI
jgi:hypothetical protein